jgi:HK97 family phage major capsid protein
MNTHHNMAGHRVCAVPAGIKVKERDGLTELKAAVDGYARSAETGFRQLTEQSEKTAERVAGVDARMHAIEQKMARSATGSYDNFGDHEVKSLGEGLIEDDRFKTFVGNGGRGHYRFVKTITSASNSAGAVAPPDNRTDIILRPQTRLTVRDLLSQATTTSNLIQVPRELLFTNNAAVVAETVTKPTSELTFELLEVSVRTIAHLMAASRQILDDAPQLRDTVDTKMRYGLGIVEEMQLLLGSGIGENIHGLVPQATTYDEDTNIAGDNPADTILHAISQVETASQLPVDGIVVNSTDWSAMLGIKTDDGNYLSGGPFGTTRPMLWGRPVVDTPSMPSGEFMVGAFRQAATIYDRMTVEVLLSSEHADFFAKNLIAIRAEERLALVVTKPWALVHGSYPTP